MSYTCPRCGMTSYNPNDEREGYCGNCSDWTGPQHPEAAGRKTAARLIPSPLPPCPCGRGITERHHIDGDPTNNDLSNIALLCRLCHMEEDGRLDALVERNKERTGVHTTKACTECGAQANPLRKGLCHRCNERQRRA